MKRVMTLTAAAATALLLGACGSSSDSTTGDAQSLDVTITDDGCSPTDLKATAGPAIFVVSNDESAVNNEFEVLDGALIVGERENVTAGLSGEVSVSLDPG